jgi:Protein of unknown function (DUF3443)
VQIIGDSDFASAPADCVNGSLFPPATSPSQIAANGIIGVGLLPQDCGTPCESTSAPTNPTYYSCNSASPSGTCTVTPQALSDQVPNPVAQLPVDNNGVVVKLPSISSSGSPSVSGVLLFGIGTESNNQLGSATVLTANSFLNIDVTYKGTSMPDSFIDSGSNFLFFDDSSISPCPSPNNTLYCPASALDLSADAAGQNGNSSTVDFEVANAVTLLSSDNFAFNDLGANNGSLDEFDLGLPFFYGRSVFAAIQGAMTPGGPGPYFAF